MTRETSSRVSGETSPRPLSTRETVAIETPAAWATSRIVTRGGPFGERRASSATVPLNHVPERFGSARSRSAANVGLFLDFATRNVLNTFRNRLRTLFRVRSCRPTLGEKGKPNATQLPDSSTARSPPDRRSTRRHDGTRCDGGGSRGRPRPQGGPPVPRDARIGRSGLHQELQSVRRRRPADQRHRPGRLLRAPDRRTGRRPQKYPRARPPLEVG